MTVVLGDCCVHLKEMASGSVDLIYLDPPFFTQKTHALKSRESLKEYAFDDCWESLEAYLQFMKNVLKECQRVLKHTGSIFLHCDKTASHYLRVLLDEVFGREQFQSEIIWSYKRWSNAKKGLLNAHQTIFFYSQSKQYTFNTLYTDYSPTTNIDQILQERSRNQQGKSDYKRDLDGKPILGKEKKGVPLSDVWEIPFLNPKAKERSGYPTQKPVLLLEQIIKIASNEHDVVLDPFCGSGTTLVAAKRLNRRFIGIDCSKEATELTQQRLTELCVTTSRLLVKGLGAYQQKTEKELALLNALEALPVQRNLGLDGLLKTHYNDKPVPVKIQKEHETLIEAKKRLLHASKAYEAQLMILIKTHALEDNLVLFQQASNDNVLVIDAYDLTIQRWMRNNCAVDPLGERQVKVE